MKRHLIIYPWAVIIALLMNGTRLEIKAEENPAGQRLHTIFDEYFEDYLKLFPTFASQIGDSRYNDQLENDISSPHRKKQKELYSKYLSMITVLKRGDLTERDKISYDIFKENLEMQLESFKYKFHLLPFNQMDGKPIYFANMGSGKDIHPFNKVKDYYDFLKRIKDFAVWTDTAISNMRLGMKEKVVYPGVIIERLIEVVGNIISDDVTKSIFYMPVQNFPGKFTMQEKEKLRDLYANAIKTEINPTYKKLYAFLKTEYLPAGRKSISWGELPDGKNWYKFLIKSYTTTDKGPDEIYQTGLKEVERIEREMDSVKNVVGFKGDLKSFIEYMRTNPELYYSRREDLINGYKEIRSIVSANLSNLFGKIPGTDFEIRPVPGFQEKSAPGAYYMYPSQDGSRPGVFYANTYDLKARPKYDMQCTFLHETLPGHHFQISIAQEQKNLPKFRKFAYYGAYMEGWALYTESLGSQLGLYKDAYNYFGRLSSEMLRAIRLVVDVGIHTRNWSKEQAIQYMLDNCANGKTDIIAEVERYIADPGQALTYKIGEIKIRELIARGREKLGKSFDLKSFHDELLKDGAMPLNILENKMNYYINRNLVSLVN